MQKLFLVSISFLFSFHTKAQTSLVFEENYPNSKSIAGIEADYNISSNSVTNKFVNAYINNKFIDDDVKDASLKKMKDKNQLGSMLNAGFYYRHKTKSFLGIANTSCFLGVHHRSHFNTQFSSDLFQLYFYGNRPFAGKTADISNFSYRGIQYQQLQFGVLKQAVKKDKIVGYAFSVSALNGQNYLEIKTSKGSLFTHADAEYIDMNLALKAQQSDTTNKKFGSSNGIGASAMVKFNFGKLDKYNVSFSASDLGFIAWNNKSNAFTVDTNYHFEGVKVDNLLDSLYLDLKSETDFKDGFKKEKESKSFTTSLPLCVNFSYEQTLIYTLTTFTVGFQYIFDADYKPCYFLKTNYYFNSKIRAGFYFEYGGWEGYHTGFHANVDCGKGFIISAESRFLSGYFNTKKSTGQGAYAAVKKVF